MNIEDLIKSAAKLPKTGTQSIMEYENKREILVAEVNSKMLARADIDQLVGSDNIEMMKNNHSNHARFIVSILSAPNPEQLVETVDWVFRSYMSRGFHANYWAAQLNVWVSALENNLSSESYMNIYPLYNWLIVNIPAFQAQAALD